MYFAVCCYAGQEYDARLVAEIEEEKLRDAEMEKERVEHERTEKAYLRHKHALEKESLKEVMDVTLPACTAAGLPSAEEL